MGEFPGLFKTEHLKYKGSHTHNAPVSGFFDTGLQKSYQSCRQPSGEIHLAEQLSGLGFFGFMGYSGFLGTPC